MTGVVLAVVFDGSGDGDGDVYGDEGSVWPGLNVSTDSSEYNYNSVYFPLRYSHAFYRKKNFKAPF